MEKDDADIPRRNISCIVDYQHKPSVTKCENDQNSVDTYIETRNEPGSCNVIPEDVPLSCTALDVLRNMKNKNTYPIEQQNTYVEEENNATAVNQKHTSSMERNMSNSGKTISDYSCYVKVQDIYSAHGSANASAVAKLNHASCSVIVDAREIYPGVKVNSSSGSNQMETYTDDSDVNTDAKSQGDKKDYYIEKEIERPINKSGNIIAEHSQPKIEVEDIEHSHAFETENSFSTGTVALTVKQDGIEGKTDDSNKQTNAICLSGKNNITHATEKHDKFSRDKISSSSLEIENSGAVKTTENIMEYASQLNNNPRFSNSPMGNLEYCKEASLFNKSKSVDQDLVGKFRKSYTVEEKNDLSSDKKNNYNDTCISTLNDPPCCAEKEICMVTNETCPLKTQGVICTAIINEGGIGTSISDQVLSNDEKIESKQDTFSTSEMEQDISYVVETKKSIYDTAEAKHSTCFTELEQARRNTQEVTQDITCSEMAEKCCSKELGHSVTPQHVIGLLENYSGNAEMKQNANRDGKIEQVAYSVKSMVENTSCKTDFIDNINDGNNHHKKEKNENVLSQIEAATDSFHNTDTHHTDCNRETKQFGYYAEKEQSVTCNRETEPNAPCFPVFQNNPCPDMIEVSIHRAMEYDKHKDNSKLIGEKPCKHKIEEEGTTVIKKLKLVPTADEEEIPLIESLNDSAVLQGMLLLGCITEISNNGLKLSLPGCLEGFVSLAHISSHYDHRRSCHSEDQSVVEPSYALQSMFYLGQVLPCRVLSVVIQPVSYKSTISLSINPEDVNCNLNPSVLYHNMVLHAAIKSCEDHGYVMDVGIPGVEGFISINCFSSQSQHQYEMIVGQVIPTLVQLPSESSTCKVLHLVPHLKFQGYPEVLEIEKLDLISLLPGTVIKGFVQEFRKQELLLICAGFEGYVWKNHLPLDLLPECLIGTEVLATVIFTHPNSHHIYLTLSEMIAYEQRMKIIYSYKKWDLIENAVVKHAEEDFISFDLGENIRGHAFKKDFPDPDNPSTSEFVIGSLHRCCVVAVHPLDNLIRVTVRRSILNMKFIKLNELTVGSIFTGKVYKFAKNGMFIKLSPNVRGFARDILITDGPVKHPEMLFKLGAIVACRVVSFDTTAKPYILDLTCKRQLCDPCLPILVSYNNAYPGFITKGVVISISTNYIVLLFFNNVQGIVPNALVENEGGNLQEMYFLGQVIKCQVTYCDPTEKVLHLSLKDMFQEFNPSTYPHLGIGEITEVRIKSATATGFHVQFPTSDVTAFLPHSHLTDISDHALTLAQLYSVNAISKALIFRTRGCVIVTQKPSFMQAAEKGFLQQQISNLYAGKVIPVVVREFHADAMTVDLGNDVIGYVPKMLIRDNVLEDVSDCGYSRGQTLIGKVLSCTEQNEIKLTTRVSDVYCRNPAYSLDALQMYLDDRERIREFYADCDGPSRDFANLSVGNIVSAKVKYVTSERVCYELDNGIRGFTSVFNYDQNLEVGVSHQAAVLYVDSHSYKVEVSFSQRLVKSILERKNRESTMIRPGDIVRGRAVFLCKEFVLASLEGGAAGLFAYLPCRKIINDTVGRHRFYSVGQKYSIFIKRVSGDKIFGVLEKHQKLYEQEILKARQGSQKVENKEEDYYSQTMHCAPETIHINAEVQSKTTSIEMSSVSSDVALNAEMENSSKCVGGIYPAVILNVRKLQVNVLIKPNLRGRIHVTNMGCSKEGEYPLKRFSKNAEIDVHIIGFNTRKNHGFSDRNDQVYEEFAECIPSEVPYVEPPSSYSVGENVLGFIKEIDRQYIFVSLDVKTLAKLPILHMSNRAKDLRSIKKRYKLGQSVESRVWIAHKDNIILTKFGSWDVKQGHHVSALIQFCSRDQGISVKLPHGYTGDIAMTDVSDDYNATDHFITKFLEQRFIQCFVLEVDSSSKSCMLSTRASRLFGSSEGIIDKEITPFDVYRGQYYRGFVKVMTPISIHLNLGRKFEGIVKLHRFSEEEKDALKIDYPVGSIMLIIIKSVSPRMIQCQMVKRSSETGSPHSSRIFISGGLGRTEENKRERVSGDATSNELHMT